MYKWKRFIWRVNPRVRWAHLFPICWGWQKYMAENVWTENHTASQEVEKEARSVRISNLLSSENDLVRVHSQRPQDPSPSPCPKFCNWIKLMLFWCHWIFTAWFNMLHEIWQPKHMQVIAWTMSQLQIGSFIIRWMRKIYTASIWRSNSSSLPRDSPKHSESISRRALKVHELRKLETDEDFNKRFRMLISNKKSHLESFLMSISFKKSKWGLPSCMEQDWAGYT